MHQPDGEIVPSTSLQEVGGWKFAQFRQACAPFGLGLYAIALGDIFAAAAGEAARLAAQIAPPPAAATNRKSRRDTLLFDGAWSWAIGLSNQWDYAVFVPLNRETVQKD